MGLFRRKGSTIWYYTFMHEGKQIERSTGTSMKSDALRKIPEIEDSVRLGKKSLIRSVEALAAVQDYVDTLIGRKRDPAYCSRLRKELTDFVQALSIPFEQISERDVADTLRRLEQLKYSASTVAQRKKHLVNFFNHCLEAGWIRENPAINVKTFRGPKVRPKRAFTPEEWSRFIVVPSPRRILKYRIMALSGLRKRELSQLTSEDFTLNSTGQSFWHLAAGKDKSRKCHRNPMLRECAELILPFQGVYRPFPGEVESEDFDRDLQKAGVAKELGGRFLTPHSLRYTFCTSLHRAGVPIAVVQRLMRHASLQLTAKLYNDLGIDDVTAWLERIPSLNL